MTAQEREIYYLLKARRPEAVAAREIGRRLASRQKFNAFPDWATHVLAGMAERGIVETDVEGRYRLKPIPQAQTAGRQWVSPEIAKILKAKGKDFDKLITVDHEDEYYDQL